MSMSFWINYYTFVAVVVALCVVAVAWYRSATARQASRDQAALSKYDFGVKFNTPEVGLPHDQQKATAASKVAEKTARRQRKVAASRAVLPPVVRRPPATVTSIRKAKS